MINDIQYLLDMIEFYNFKNFKMKVLFPSYESTWSRVHGIKIGSWFFGAIKSTEDYPDVK